MIVDLAICDMLRWFQVGAVMGGNGGRDIVEFPLVPIEQQQPDADSPESPPPPSPLPAQSTLGVCRSTDPGFRALKQQLADLLQEIMRVGCRI